MEDKVGGGCRGEEMKRECASNWHTSEDSSERRVHIENSNKPLIEGIYPLTSYTMRRTECRICGNLPHV